MASKLEFVYLGSKIQQTKIGVAKKFGSLFKAEPVYESKLKVILLLQVSRHDFEPTFNIFCLNWRNARPAHVKTNHQTFDSLEAS